MMQQIRKARSFIRVEGSHDAGLYLYVQIFFIASLIGTLNARTTWTCGFNCTDLDEASVSRCVTWYLAQAINLVDEEWQSVKKLSCSKYIKATTQYAAEPCKLPHIRCNPNNSIISINTSTDLNAQGAFPTQLAALTGLTALDFSGNQLTGSLSDELSSLVSLTNMRLRKCGIRGQLPAVWKSLSSLRFLDLSHNGLTGSLPSSWTSLQALQQLRLSSNTDLTGPVPKWEGSTPLQLWLDNTSLHVSHDTRLHYCLKSRHSMIYSNRTGAMSRFEAHSCSGPLMTRFVVGTAWGIFFLLLVLSCVVSFILSSCCPDHLHTDWIARQNNSQVELLTVGPNKHRDWCLFEWKHMWAVLGGLFAVLEVVGDLSVLALLAPGFNGNLAGLKALVACMVIGLLIPFLALVTAFTISYTHAGRARPRATHLQLLTSCNPLKILYFTHWLMALSTSAIFSITTTCALLWYGVFFSGNGTIGIGVAAAALSCQLACMLVHIFALLEAGLAPEVPKCCGCWGARLAGLGRGLVRGDAWEDRFGSSRRPVHQAMFVLQARGQA